MSVAVKPLPSAPKAPPSCAVLALLISCPDKPGIVAAVSRFLFEAGANIVRSDQYSADQSPGRSSYGWSSPLTTRTVTDSRSSLGSRSPSDSYDVAAMDSTKRKRVAVLVSRYDHCLQDLLWRWRREISTLRSCWWLPTGKTCAVKSRRLGCRFTTCRSQRR